MQEGETRDKNTNSSVEPNSGRIIHVIDINKIKEYADVGRTK